MTLRCLNRSGRRLSLASDIIRLSSPLDEKAPLLRLEADACSMAFLKGSRLELVDERCLELELDLIDEFLIDADL